ncbi:Phospholipase A-2-activating protein [Thelohanellus kitauei]|uniref:Phospholipase A-2-activating protein n=1 Tax=Thelohanellus kitauei TaxID=669202 RepID=A0A0C2IY59_THEKT|nr:Phospholipase A-2-activating protein [Thelohanellus kitauei]
MDGMYENYLTFQYGQKYGLVVKYHKFKKYEVVIIGALDCAITLRDVRDGVLVCEMLGHSGGVAAIEIYKDCVLSGSWDSTIKVWSSEGNLLNTLMKHEGSVWCLKTISDGFLSGSADSTIIYWQNFEPKMTFCGHTGPVRDLIVLEKTHFVSCSNDYSVRVWELESEESVSTLTGHSNFIYSLTRLSDSSFASSGEENNVRIWRDMKLVDEIFVPSTTNWCVRGTPNGSLLIGSSLHYVMVFGRDILSNSFDIEEFDGLIRESMKTSAALGGVDITKLPSVETGLSKPGTFNGETKMMRKGVDVVIYEWNESTKQWDFVGNAVRELTDEEKTQTKTTFRGVEYDHVIDVEMEDGRKLKLPYNNGDDPSDAATQFLEANNLGMFFHKQVVDFLIASIPSAGIKPVESNVKTNFAVTDYIFFETTNVVGLLKRMRSDVDLTDFDASTLQKYLESSLNGRNLSISFDSFPWLKFDTLFPASELSLLPILDMVKQLVLFEPFYVRFFVDRKNFYHFGLLEFVTNFMDEKIEVKCRMLSIKIYCNSFIHSEKFSQNFLRDLPELCKLIGDFHLWIEEHTQLSIAALVLNLSIFLIRSKCLDSVTCTNVFHTITWIMEAHRDILAPGSLCHLLNALENVLCSNISTDSVKNDLQSLKTMLPKLEVDPKVSILKDELMKKFSKLLI